MTPAVDVWGAVACLNFMATTPATSPVREFDVLPWFRALSYQLHLAGVDLNSQPRCRDGQSFPSRKMCAMRLRGASGNWRREEGGNLLGKAKLARATMVRDNGILAEPFIP